MVPFQDITEDANFNCTARDQLHHSVPEYHIHHQVQGANTNSE